MDKILDVAAYIATKYTELTGEKLSEMKLHKLLYFTQRESLAITGTPAFEGDFEGWMFGPVCREVRQHFFDGRILGVTQTVSDAIQYIANNVIFEYGSLEAWKLSELSHKDISWQNARKGLSPNDVGDKVLELDDIRKDAAKIRPYDHVWGMYYDEFEDEVMPG